METTCNEWQNGHPAEAGQEASIFHLLGQLLVAKATELARLGSFSEAEELLAASAAEKGGAAAQDLRARMLAQQGRLAEAEAVWAGLARRYPDNRAYGAARQRLAMLQRPGKWWLSSRFLTLGLAGMLFLAIGWGVHGHLAEGGQSPALGIMAGESMRQTRSSGQSGQEVVAGELAELRRELQAQKDAMNGQFNTSLNQIKGEMTSLQTVLLEELQNPQAKVPAPPEIQVTTPGVMVRDEGPNRILVFDDGLFEAGLRLRPGAKQQLAELGRELAPYSRNVTLTVYGHADNLLVKDSRRYSDNLALGLQRAAYVAELLRRDCGLPPAMLRVAGRGEQLAPYPMAGEADRRRNRTVVIEVAGNGG